MAPTLNGKTIAFLVAPEGIEQVELTEPWKAVEEAGGTPRLRLDRQPARCRRSTTSTRPTRSTSTTTVDGDAAADYDGLVLPGGVANPDALRTRRRRRRVRRRRSSTPASRWRRSATRRGRWSRPTWCAAARMTSWPSLQTDLRNAGADWVDEEVVVSNGRTLVTSRKPDDLQAFCGELVDRFAAA